MDFSTCTWPWAILLVLAVESRERSKACWPGTGRFLEGTVRRMTGGAWWSGREEKKLMTVVEKKLDNLSLGGIFHAKKDELNNHRIRFLKINFKFK